MKSSRWDTSTPNKSSPDIQPRPEDGTVDIGYDLVSKANDQVEFSAGWGQTGIIGKLSLKFTNFSLSNLLHPGENYRGILPQGDGQTLTISGQTNAKYYQSYSVSFYDPWFGGKRPNAFSVSAFYSRQTDISSRYYNSAYMNSYYNSYYSGMYGYGMYKRRQLQQLRELLRPGQIYQMYGLAVMFGKRLKWPDDYFQFTAELSYQRYVLSDWQYFPVTNGKCNNLSLNLTLSRSSIDNPIYPRQGSEFSLSAQITPPFSLFDGTDYSKYSTSSQEDMNKMHKWIEYHKWKFKSKVYIPLMDPITVKRTPVLMGRVEFGLLGHYNKYKKSPFETFDVGGDGMTGYSSYATESIALRGYENSSLTPYGSEGYAYTRLGLELRYPLMLETSTSIYALTFVEAGNAWHDVNKFNPFELKRSAGVGVRIFLPMIGMMGIDWAYGFDKINGSTQYSGSQFHFHHRTRVLIQTNNLMKNRRMRNEESKAMANNQFFIYHSSLHLKTTLLMKKVFFLAALLVCSIAAQAQRFALVDMEYILKQIPAYEQANQQMESLSKQWQSEVEAKAQEAKTMYDEYQKKRF